MENNRITVEQIYRNIKKQTYLYNFSKWPTWRTTIWPPDDEHDVARNM